MKDTRATRPTDETDETGTSPAAAAIEQRIVALAEQVGRLVGAAQARTDGWLDRQALNEQLTRIRDGASGLLGQLAGDAPAAAGNRATTAARRKPALRATGKANARARSGGAVDAPGKAHRKAPAPARGVKHSDQAVAKTRAALQARRARRG